MEKSLPLALDCYNNRKGWGKKMKRLVGFFKPRRIDAILWCGVGLTLAAMVAPTLMHWDANTKSTGLQFYPIAMAILVGLLLVLASVAGACRIFDRRETVAVWASIAIAIGVFGWSLDLHGIWSPSELNESSRLSYTEWLDLWGWKSIRLLAYLFLGAVLVMYSVSEVVHRIWGKSLGFDRSRFLIVLAMLGGVFAVLKNIADQNVQFGQMTSWLFSSSTVGNSLLGLVVVFLGSLLIRTNRLWARLVLVVAALVFILVSGIFDVVFARFFGASFSYSLIAFWLSFLSPFLLIGSKAKNADEEPSDVGKTAYRPSAFLGTAALLVLVGGGWFIRTYDVPTLLICKANRFEAAKLAGSLKRLAGVEIVGDLRDTTRNRLRLVFSDHSGLDALKPLRSSPYLIDSLALENLSPDVDWCLSPKVIIAEIEFRDSSLSALQLCAEANRALGSGKPTMLIFNNSKLQGVGKIPAPTSPWSFINCRPGQISETLSRIETFEGNGSFSVRDCSINARDWNELVRAAQRYDIDLAGITWPRDLVDCVKLQPGISLKNLTYRDHFLNEEIEAAVENVDLLSRNTDMCFDLDWGVINEEYPVLPSLIGLKINALKKLLSVSHPERLFASKGRMASLHVKRSNIDLETWEKITTVSSCLNLYLEECEMPDKLFESWTPTGAALDKIRLDRPLNQKGEIDYPLLLKFAVQTDIVVGAGRIDLSRCGDLISARLPPRESQSKKRLLDCSRFFWTFNRLAGNFESPTPCSLDEVWTTRIEELKREPGQMEDKVFTELEELGFAWRDDKERANVWIPSSFCPLLDALNHCPKVKVVMYEGRKNEAELEWKASPANEIEELYLPWGEPFPRWEKFLDGTNSLRKVCVDQSWLDVKGAFAKQADLNQVEFYVYPQLRKSTALRTIKSLRKVDVFDLGSTGFSIEKLKSQLPGVEVTRFEYKDRIEELTRQQRARMRARVANELFPDD